MKNRSFTIHPIERMNPFIVKILSKETDFVSRHYGYGLDKYVLIHIKKQPRWMPKKVWFWVLKHFLVMSEFCIPNSDVFRV